MACADADRVCCGCVDVAGCGEAWNRLEEAGEAVWYVLRAEIEDRGHGILVEGRATRGKERISILVGCSAEYGGQDWLLASERLLSELSKLFQMLEVDFDGCL